MIEQYKHELSQLMDNGGIDAKLLAKLTADDELRAQWMRYHLIRDALHDDIPEQLHLSIADKVSAAIASEPTVLAPRNRWSVIRKFYQQKPWVKQVSGFALAASVTAVTIFSVQALLLSNTAPSNTAVWQPLNPQQVASQPTVTTKHQAIPHTMLVNQQQLERQQLLEELRQQRLERINTYLLQHAENSSSRGVHGMFPYARVVSYEE